ncbi:hypothetical protein BGZ65_011757, partial [Modicella reniformis]
VLAFGAFAAGIMDYMKALKELGKTIKEMETPIRTIYTKLNDNIHSLELLKGHNTDITSHNYPEDIRQRQYEHAQQEACRIDEACQEIRRYSLDFDL